MSAESKTSQQHTMTLKVGPSGVRADCSCGWGGMPRYSDQRAEQDHAEHLHASEFSHGDHVTFEVGRRVETGTITQPYADGAKYGIMTAAGEYTLMVEDIQLQS